MSESQPASDASPSESSWQELASRDGDGLVVHLDWCRPLSTVRVVVDDRRHGQQFELDVAPEDALVAFRHPFAYAAAHGSSRLALQDALGLSHELEGASHVR